MNNCIFKVKLLVRIGIILFILYLLFIPDFILGAISNRPPVLSLTTNIIVKSTNTNVVLSLTAEQKRYIFINTALSNASKNELIEICKKLNINSKGTKDEIIIRIKSFLSLDVHDEKEVKEQITIDKYKDIIIIENAEEGEYLQVTEDDQKLLSATGEVHLIYNKIRLRSDKIKLNTRTREMLCEGNVVLFDGSKEITGDRVFYNLDTSMGIIYSGKSQIGDLVYRGEKIKKGA